MKKSLSFALVLVGTLIGAGFATGRELCTFFASFGRGAVYWFVLACALLILGSGCCYFYSKRKGIRSYEGYLRSLLGEGFGRVLYFLTLLFLLACFCVTAAGAGTLFRDSFQMPYSYGVVVILVVSFATLLYDMQGIYLVNGFLTPLILLAVFLFGGAVFLTNTVSVFAPRISSISLFSLFSPFLYVGYNLLSLLPIVLSAKESGMTDREARGGFLWSFLLFVTAGFFVLTALPSDASELPFLEAVSAGFSYGEALYGIPLYFAMVTTAVSCHFGFVTAIASCFRFPKYLISAVSCLVALILSIFPFSALVERVYGIFGVVGIFLLICSLCGQYSLKQRINYATMKKRSKRDVKGCNIEDSEI